MHNKLRNWRSGVLPKKTAVFVIGDLHGEYKLLQRLVRQINIKIVKLPRQVKKEIIFIGDYIDRGFNSKSTVKYLIELKKFFLRQKSVNLHFLCGNHDDFFSKLLTSNGLIEDPKNDILFKKDPLYKLIKSPSNSIYLSGFKTWYDIGGGRTTIEDYYPIIINELDLLLNEKNIGKNGKKINLLVEKFKQNIPHSHFVFFRDIVKNFYYILGQYLFIHAGVLPNKKLSSQGIGKKNKKLNQYDFIKLLMIRDPFLWTKKIYNCPFYVIHGHTPSEILKSNMVVADGNKSFRLCLDTKVYSMNGSLTCFYKYKNSNKFISISKKNNDIKLTY